MEDPVVPLEKNLYGHPVAGLLWERQFEKVQLEHGWGKVLNWECFFVNRARRLFLSVNVDDKKLASKTENIEWSGRTYIILDHVFLGCTLISVMKLWQTTEICWNAGFLLEAMKNYRPEVPVNLMHTQYLLSLMTLKVTQRNVCKDVANLRIKRLSNETKSQRHA